MLRSVQISINPLQWPLLGMILLGLIQLLPLRAPDSAGLPLSPARTLSLDPHATRLVLVQVVCLLIYFAASLIFIDTPRRLHHQSNNNHLRIPAGGVWFDSVSHYGWHAGLLVSAIDAKPGVRPVHQPASFRWLHGANHRSAVGLVVLRRA